MILDKVISKYNLVLASNSPRRKQFLTDLGVPYSVRTANVEEVYPETLKASEITNYLAKLKAAPLLEDLAKNELLITSDTIVWLNEVALGKPANEKDAFEMISSLSGTSHKVISSVCLSTKQQQIVESVTTKVTFRILTKEEILYYITNFKPFDKAGAYGIQEWIGHIGITSIEGSYNNVVGLPTAQFYQMLQKFI
ncbi:Maf family nucleotide pyrophosphatase [Neptunitalea lumnitzerae]|uniref:dTTP/UTP pyrophosphatase n=1 Tax=Neptunitalea lumnitzerae TaxID=2965509 RepID=A0ABQ5MJF8_9FLAO|nr:Maf family nucleotide pyrophosphatase [Neptunitalea sp. Y10]GLB49547.1 Maf-like protein [Neptunitalea sp. Y10]